MPMRGPFERSCDGGPDAGSNWIESQGHESEQENRVVFGDVQGKPAEMPVGVGRGPLCHESRLAIPGWCSQDGRAPTVLVRELLDQGCPPDEVRTRFRHLDFGLDQPL